jgi:hypothetical protein
LGRNEHQKQRRTGNNVRGVTYLVKNVPQIRKQNKRKEEYSKYEALRKLKPKRKKKGEGRHHIPRWA